MSRKTKHFTDDDNLIVKIESIGFEGISIARNENLVYFVKQGIPGDTALIKPIKKKKNHIEAEIVEIINKSEIRATPECKYFGVCGGCSWQNLIYSEQAKWKRQQIMDCFQRIAKFENPLIENTIESPKIFEYRNKMEFSFAPSRWLSIKEIQSEEPIINKNFGLGLHIPNLYQKVLDIDDCKLFDSRGLTILNRIRVKAIELNLEPYNIVKNEGFLRNLVIRKSVSTDDFMVILICNDFYSPNQRTFYEWFCTDLINEFPYVTSLIYAINPSHSPVAVGEIAFVGGKDYISEEILGIKYKISPFSFFQTNTYQLVNFLKIILNFANISKNETIWDLYCGTGSISLVAANQSKKIIGIELVESSVNDAKSNAILNMINNVEFFAMDLHSKKFNELVNDIDKPDTIILDPPRAGLHKNLISSIISLSPNKIVYVSCNPATQARDCELFSEHYNLIKIQPVDMFPHTFHIESIALLEKK